MLPILVASAWLSVCAESLPAVEWKKDLQPQDDEASKTLPLTPEDKAIWSDRGGPELWLEAALVGSFSLRRDGPVTSPGGGEVFGLGSALRWGVLVLRVPDIENGDAAFTGFRTGAGFEIPQGILLDTDPGAGGRTVLRPSPLLVNVPFFFGGQWSIGRFIHRTRWEGWTVGFDATPTFVLDTSAEWKPDDFLLFAGRFQVAKTHFTPESHLRSMEPQWSVSLMGGFGARRQPVFLALSFGCAWF